MGYIEACIGVDFLDEPVAVPVLVVPTTEYGLTVPLVIGTNVIRLCKETMHEGVEPPHEWTRAFLSVHDGYIGRVKATNNQPIEVPPLEAVTITGIIRKKRNVESAVTEVTQGASSRIGVCPRVVSLQKPGRTQRSL